MHIKIKSEIIHCVIMYYYSVIMYYYSVIIINNFIFLNDNSLCMYNTLSTLKGNIGSRFVKWHVDNILVGTQCLQRTTTGTRLET